jgi:hypothetical protein
VSKLIFIHDLLLIIYLWEFDLYFNSIFLQPFSVAKLLFFKKNNFGNPSILAAIYHQQAASL